jgi:hypothetical protein
MNTVMVVLILTIMVIYVTMVVRPIAAFLVELFPTRSATPPCRCPITSATAGSAACCRCWQPRWWRPSGDIYYGLWYPILVAVMSLVIGLLFLRKNYTRTIED